MMNAEIYSQPIIRIAGDQGVLVELGNAISPEVHIKVRALNLALEQAALPGVVECVQTYRSVVIHYDPLITQVSELKEQINRLFSQLGNFEVPVPKTVELPVCYGGDMGPDLDHVATVNELSTEEVITRHSQPDYLIYMVGFTPGFPFLGGLDESLHTPRLESPRKVVPAGSVGIANNQTGVYPVQSPGGWQLIGRVPVDLFNPEQENPFLLSAGDLLRFRPISREEYEELSTN